MKIKSISAKDVPPIDRFAVSDLADVVVLAGRNGVGKTRLVQQFLAFFQAPEGSNQVAMVIEATCSEEVQKWGKDLLDTQDPSDAQILRTTLQENRLRRNWRSSVINFESDRTIQKINPYQFTWDIGDPDKEGLGWNATFSGLRNRWQDTLHSIFRKEQAHRQGISQRAITLKKQGKKSMRLKFKSPLKPFRTAFKRLLSPKKLKRIDVRTQSLIYELDGQELDVKTLSSGEREVVNVVFDFILRQPSDCIVFFDEPELHLHPELSHKLISTLRRSGNNNQFIFCTHSPAIITSSLENSVVFLGPPKGDGTNQAIPVSEDDETNRALRLLGQSIGIVALGKKIVLIEGGSTSLDKELYSSILEERFPDLVLVPSSGKDQITSFSTVVEEVLKKSVWGVDFFMLCDSDAVSPVKEKGEIEQESDGRLKILNKYHVENYFLDENVLAAVFHEIEQVGSWLRDPAQIRTKLRQFAKELLPFTLALYTAAHFREQVGNIDIMPKGSGQASIEELTDLLIQKSKQESNRVVTTIEGVEVEDFVAKTAALLEDSLDDDSDLWKSLIPGKSLLGKFSGSASISMDRIKRSYIKHAVAAEVNPFAEIFDIFQEFSSFSHE